jgi:hypothetical protein
MAKKQTGPEFECRIPRGARVRASEPGVRAVSGDAIGIKWSSVSGYWVDVRDDAGIVRGYPADQVKVVKT